ncbi:YciI family protein [Luteolibacter sp. LG18]|uniref:YciI family protein n=1 Tax=Luteolibacter sp. LG18 TaxID=2819286 RepID=UPI002B2804B9|nr:transcription initiation protein [Luteolibacter sp. LG18]
MQFVLLIIHADPERWNSLTTDQRNAVHEACGVWHQELVDKGVAVHAVGLQPPDTTAVVRRKDGSVFVTDGPFSESKEVIGGFEIIDCASKEEAIAIAKRFPALDAGAIIEVRPAVTGPCRD